MFRTGLVIGVHQQERAFGERVVKGIHEKNIEVIRIQNGLVRGSDWKNRSSFHGSDLHKLYLWIHQQVCGKYDLVVDLHCGSTEGKWSADILAEEIGFLDFLHAGAKDIFQDRYALPDTIRLVRIVSDIASQSDIFSYRYLVCKPFIPEEVAKKAHYRYVGIEIYLSAGGKGCREDYRLSRRLLRAIHKCAMEYTFMTYRH